MVRTWIVATGVLAVGAVALFRKWRRRHGEMDVLSTEGQAVSAEWLSQARAHSEETWP